MLRTLLLFLLLASLACPRGAAAAGERRPGPAVEPAPELPRTLQQDPRLEKRLTLQMGRRPLSEVLEALQKGTGVRIQATAGVADQPAVVWITDQPARTIMHHLALLFRYRWARIGTDGKWRYELYQDADARAEEAALRERARRQPFEDVLRQVRLDLSLLARSPDDLQRQHDELHAVCERWFERLYHLPREQKLAVFRSEEYERVVQQSKLADACQRMALPVPRAIAGVAAGLSQEQWNQLLDEDALTFGTRPGPGVLPLPAGAAAALRTARPSYAALKGIQDGPEGEANLEQQEREAQARWSEAKDLRVTLSLRRGASSGLPTAIWRGTVTLLLPDGKKASADPYGSGWMLDGHSMPSGNGADGPEEVTYPDWVPTAWVSDPQLGAKQRLRVERPTDPWADQGLAGSADREWKPVVRTRDLLPQIARAYGLNLVADAPLEDGWGLRDLPSGQELALYYVLNKWVLRNARWTRVGDIFHVGSYTWYLDREAEVPFSLARAWASRVRRQPQLSLDDAARLVLALNDEQLNHFDLALREEGVWVGSAFNHFLCGQNGAGGSRELLRLFAGLLPAQRAALLHGGALPYERLSLEAQRWVRRALRARQENDYTLQTEPMSPEQSWLALEVRPAQRRVAPDPGGFRIEYQPAGRRIDFKAPMGAGMEDLFYQAFVPTAPGLVPPVDGQALEASFVLQGPELPAASYAALIPCVAWRAPVRESLP
jgi:hypothetical protein